MTCCSHFSLHCFAFSKGRPFFAFLGRMVMTCSVIFFLKPGGPLLGPGKRGLVTKGSFSVEASLESLKSLNSLESLESWSESPFFSRVWGFWRTSRISKISRKWTFLKRPLFQKTPFPEPELPKFIPLKWQCVREETHFEFPASFDVFVFILNSNSLSKRFFHVYVFISVRR